jgi:hypothetical protein
VRSLLRQLQNTSPVGTGERQRDYLEYFSNLADISQVVDPAFFILAAHFDAGTATPPLICRVLQVDMAVGREQIVDYFDEAFR